MDFLFGNKFSLVNPAICYKYELKNALQLNDMNFTKTSVRTVKPIFTFIIVQLLILFSISFGENTVYAQGYVGNDDYIPPSPNAYGLMSAVNTSVNLYTGTAQINLPLTSISGRKLSVPITLNYNASGVKVQDVPGWVGTGWSLDAGGVITRIVRGLPDEEANGFCGSNNIGEKVNETITSTYLSKVVSQEWDSEPDLFYFNFLNKKGRFILDETGTPVLLPYSNLKITPGICTSGSDTWVITDENGVKYTFGVGETTSYKVRDESSKSFVSSWYLSEVRTANDEDVITFDYASALPVSYSYYIQEYVQKVYQSNALGEGCGLYDANTKNKNLDITLVSPRYLKSISSVSGKVTFYKSARADFLSPTGLKLDRIVVENNEGAIINSINLKYSYFLGEGCHASDFLCKRLKLDAVFKSGNDIHQKLYAFQYNDLNLPPRYSNSIDHWGYYNSNSYTSKIPSVQVDYPCPKYYPGADRGPDTTRSKANILTKVIDSKGGYTEYIYSAHQYSDDGATNKFAGGVRIRMVNRCTGNGDCTSTYYYYKKFNTSISSGSLAALPVYHFHSGTATFQPMTMYSGFWTIHDYLVITSNSLKDIFDVDGYHIGYGKVTEKVPGLGYTNVTFTDVESNPDISPQQSSYRDGDYRFEIGSNAFPFTPSTTKSSERGLVRQKDYYNQNNALVKQEILNYNLNDPLEIKNVKSLHVGKRGFDPVYSYYWVGSYRHISKPYVLTSTTEIIYDQQYPGVPGENDKRVSQSTEYSYIKIDPPGSTNMSLDLLPRKITQALPTGEKIITENKYVSDYPFTASPSADASRGLYGMQQKHIHNALVESISYLERYENSAPVKYLISGVLNLYRPFPTTSGKVYPFQTLKLKANGSTTITTYNWSTIVGQEFSYPGASRFKLMDTFSSYDDYGNLLSAYGSDGIPRVMTYGNNNSLLASSSKNPVGGYQHQDQYQQRSLVGALQHTDANLNTTSYEYNNFNELKLVKDESGNILERYSNNVKGQLSPAAPVSLGLNITGTKTVNSTLTFSTNELVSDFGTTTYTWDFGDGTSGSGRSASKTYSQAGTYRITATVNNPRYGVAKAITTIVIQ